MSSIHARRSAREHQLSADAFTAPSEFSYFAAMKPISQELLDEVTGRLAAEFQPEQVWLFRLARVGTAG
jgi:hypothetical protein